MERTPPLFYAESYKENELENQLFFSKFFFQKNKNKKVKTKIKLLYFKNIDKYLSFTSFISN